MNKELIDKIHKAVLKMMEDVSFDKEKHIYTVKSDGTWLQGVSTVSSIVPKPWLAPWGAKETVKFLGFSDYPGDTKTAEIMLNEIQQIKNVEDYIDLLRTAKGASGRKSKSALVDGTAGHDWLERYVKAKIRGTDLPEVPTGMLKRPITQFLDWEKDEVDYWILSEAMVASIKHKYAGTLDGVAMMKNGKLDLIDFKFASHISEDYRLQVAGYQNCLEEYGIKIDERIIIRLPKTLEKEEWNKKERKYYKVPNDIEIKILSKEYEEDRDVFLHCLPVKQWINTLKKK